MADGWTALFYVCFNNFQALVTLLLENGADPNRLDRLQKSPLHYAARYNNVKISKILIDKGAFYHLRDRDELTAIDVASANKNNAV